MDTSDRDAISALSTWYRGQLSAALEAGRQTEAQLVVREALDAGLSPQVVYDEMIAPAMHEIGRKWEGGELTVAQEHLATSISYGLVALVAELRRASDERRREEVVLAGVEGERHVMGLRMAGDLLEGAGFQVVFLGDDVPTDDLLDFLTARSAALCALTATMPHTRERLASTVRLIEDLLPRTGILVGGQAAARLAPLGPTTAAVDDVASVVEVADGLLQGAALN